MTGDEVGMTTEDTGWSGGGEDTLARFNSPTFSEGGGSGIYPSEEPMGESELSPLAIIIPLALLLLLAGAVTAFAISRRKAKKHSGGSGDMREDDIFSGCDTEKVPMPMFEDDVPSVLELEMEDLEKWMVKDSGGICLDSEKND
ncbi:hypothetical protein JZ751_012530 [Albula glossodonta]|uniref:Transmembrane protein 154 n=1 Tax=Albula glossodonta TaxID=121402 RepID=A0A8T2NSY7_9TELE|nr:hypothetical protein JZ751_012530 [Albula glossodonta]